MMIVSDEVRLKSEIEQVRQLLANLPEDAAIGRISLQSRIESLENELSELPRTSQPATAKITFRGPPVVETQGIFADFASKATSAFAELVAVLTAAQSKPVAQKGRIPNREQSQLLITGTAIGSFGFELREHVVQNPLPELETPVAHALEQSRELFESLLGDDEELMESIAGLDKRAINSLRGFLEVLAAHEAVCNLAVHDRGFGFRDVGQVRRGLGRLADDNLHEESLTHRGIFEGTLPNRRYFEFRVSENDELITGKISPEFPDPDQINKHLHKELDVTFTTRRLGSGNARYILEIEPNWPV